MRPAFESAAAVADAILYEGYLLYPYRKSAAKNRLRWQFGVLAPRGWAEHNLAPDEGVAGSAESWFQQTECLAGCPPDATLSLRLRFLQTQRRDIEAMDEHGASQPVPRLEIDGRLLLAFDEAVPHDHDLSVGIDRLLADGYGGVLDIPAAEDIEDIRDAAGCLRGRIVRRRRRIRARLTVSATLVEAASSLIRFRVRTENTSDDPAPDSQRGDALAHALLATHTLLALDRGGFVSLLDPPAAATAAAGECHNVHTFPVLAGDDDGRDLMLSSPIILYDHPRIAPESPGDLFDAGEIDEILSLRTLTLTDEEKREARATDVRAASIVDRVEASGADIFARLHGTFREPAVPEPAVAWWQPGGDAAIAPETDTVIVAGVCVGKGSRVRLNPRGHGTDAHDMFLAGRPARVEAVLTDVDGTRFVAVTVEGDPAGDLQKQLGRFFHFTADEIQPLTDGAA